MSLKTTFLLFYKIGTLDNFNRLFDGFFTEVIISEIYIGTNIATEQILQYLYSMTLN